MARKPEELFLRINELSAAKEIENPRLSKEAIHNTASNYQQQIYLLVFGLENGEESMWSAEEIRDAIDYTYTLSSKLPIGDESQSEESKSVLFKLAFIRIVLEQLCMPVILLMETIENTTDDEQLWRIVLKDDWNITPSEGINLPYGLLYVKLAKRFPNKIFTYNGQAFSGQELLSLILNI